MNCIIIPVPKVSLKTVESCILGVNILLLSGNRAASFQTALCVISLQF